VTAATLVHGTAVAGIVLVRFVFFFNPVKENPMISSIAYPSAIYTLVFSASFWCWIILELWVFFRERGTARDGSRDRGSTFLVIIALVVGIGLGFNMPRLAPQLNIRSNFAAFFSLGIALIFIGILFRFWAIQTLGRFFRTRVVIQADHQLVTSGPYKYLRNPSYTGILIVLLGLGFGVGNWASILVFFATGVITYGSRIAFVEERALREQFGQEYQDYKKRTWALIPFIW
jgi:protein-S-isoprenylcysteine O-methyltransferase Ste14